MNLFTYLLKQEYKLARQSIKTITTPAQPKKLLDQVRDKIRLKHYSLSTENTYLSWIKQFILYHGKRHPVDLGATEVELFVTYLATQRHVSSSTQNQRVGWGELVNPKVVY